MEKLSEILKGKKTYLAALIGLLYLAGVWAGAWVWDERVLAAVGLSGLAFLRAAAKKDPPNITPILLCIGLILGSAGCTTPQDAAGKSLATAAITVDAAMQGWGEWVRTGQASVEDEIAVEDAYKKYQAAMRVAITAYKQAVKVGDLTIYERAAETLRSSRAELLELISLFEHHKNDTTNSCSINRHPRTPGS